MKQIAVLLLAAVCLQAAAFAQGPLTPPGPPAPTMKTLAQVEPRTPITNLPVTISQPGSYYFASSLSGTSGVTIAASGVTLDLMGFELVFAAGAGADGISVSGTRDNIVVRDGTVRNWTANGINAAGARNSQFQGLRLYQNIGAGLVVGEGCTVTGCNVYTNGTGGIVLGADSIVRDCTASANVGDGIQGTDGCQINGNTSRTNTAAGIHVTGSDNHIEDNHVTGNATGLDADAGNNLVAGNTVKGNALNYDFAAGNQLELLLCEIPETIKWPAHVKLAGSLTGTTGANGITIPSASVTVDLGGHSLIGVPGSLDGVSIGTGGTNVVVRNGTICRWDSDGVFDGNSTTAGGCRFENLLLTKNGAIGLNAGVRSQIINCIATTNGTTGILATDGGSIVRDCIAGRNGRAGIVASAATIRNCTATSNVESGIVASAASIIEGCVAQNNGGDGIYLETECIVTGCDSHNNDLAGIHAHGFFNRIEGNTVVGNVYGIETGRGFNGGTNVVIRNIGGRNPQFGPGGFVGNSNFVFHVFTIFGPTNNLWIGLGNGLITNESPYANFNQP